LSLLAACRLASGAATLAAPDLLAAQVQALLHAHYANLPKLAAADRVLAIERRLGAYRAAQTKQALVQRLDVDLWVATRDRRVSVQESSAPAPAGRRRYALGQGLVLYLP
jgi:hypothetical protein